jgi:hypothetical protein
MHIESLHHQTGIGGGNLITKLAGERGSCFYISFLEVQKDPLKKNKVRWQDQKSGCGKN